MCFWMKSNKSFKWDEPASFVNVDTNIILKTTIFDWGRWLIQLLENYLRMFGTMWLFKYKCYEI